MNREIENDPAFTFVKQQNPSNVLRIQGHWTQNPHISRMFREQALALKQANPDLYKHVYDGEPRGFHDAIVKNVQAVPSFEEPEGLTPYGGIDYGYTNCHTAACIVWVDKRAMTIYVRPIIFALKMSGGDVAEIMHRELSRYKYIKIFQDTSHQQIGGDMKKRGLMVYSAYKHDKIGQLDRLNEYKILIETGKIPDFYSQVRMARWKSVRGLTLNDVDVNDDALDAVRYAFYYAGR
jgi:hypothetical protein